MDTNNSVAKLLLKSYGPVTEKDKALILLGMEVQREIDVNWLSVGAEGNDDDNLFSALHHKDDTFIEGENGGGWGEQAPLVLDYLDVVQPAEGGSWKRDEDIPAIFEDLILSDDESEEDEIVEDESEEDEIDYNKEKENTVHTLSWFVENRSEQYKQALEVVVYSEEHPEQKNIVVQAEEKTGKREMVEIIALLTKARKKNSYFTAFNAKSINGQIDEIESYGVNAVKCNRIEKMQEQVEEIEDDSIVHVDELDYGSGKLQSLAPLISATNITKIFYSATTHELENEMKGTDYKLFTFVPHENYRGSEWFLEEDLVHESRPFVCAGVQDLMPSDRGFTDHADELINMLTEETPVGVVRLTKRGVYKSIKEHFVDQDGMNEDGHYVRRDGLQVRFVDTDVKKPFNPAKIGDISVKTLIIVNQCWRRSTELKGHEKIRFMHDDRVIAKKGRSGVAYASLSQAVSRVKHYDSSGHKIDIYTDKDAFKISCGRVSGEGHKLYNRQGLSETNKLGSAYANN
jgi:hypothetical protein